MGGAPDACAGDEEISDAGGLRTGIAVRPFLQPWRTLGGRFATMLVRRDKESVISTPMDLSWLSLIADSLPDGTLIRFYSISTSDFQK
ncbi:hypothetical protein TSA6c_18885 [Azospirillum sp. TSA6c]|nr:hypothetical protein TSA6c_18885 [Azospirillum sp. TSA6c]